MDHRQALNLLLAALLSPSGVGLASDTSSESKEVLKRAAARIAANYHSIHSYTCLETVERDYYRPRGATLPRDCPVLMKQRENPTLDMVLILASRDRLRLEVAISPRGEINSWPGAKRFSDSGIQTVVPSGPIGTGAFGAFLDVIFQDAAGFGMAGDSILDGLRVFAYTFGVSASDSHYHLSSPHDPILPAIAYEGVLFVDAETADPVRLLVVTRELPPASNLCETASNLTFRRGTADDSDVFFPAFAAQHFIRPTGKETRNTISFSKCRKYSSESTVTFNPGPAETTVARLAATQAPPSAIPERLPFSMELLTPFDSDIAAAGDRFIARLTAPLRDGRRLIAPKGATIEGSLSDLEIEFHPAERVTFGLVPESLEIHGSKVPLAAQLDVYAQVRKEHRRLKGMQFYLPAPGERPHQFHLVGRHAILPKGFTSEWLTVGAQDSGTASTDRSHY